MSLEDFFIKTEPEVEGITGEETGTQAFMKLMEIFNKVSIIVVSDSVHGCVCVQVYVCKCTWVCMCASVCV